MKIKLNTQLYPIEVIINTCYEYLDKAYLYLDKGASGTVIVHLKPKDNIPAVKLRKVFLNDLIFARVRYQVSRNNKRATEYMIKRALYSAVKPDSPSKRKTAATKKDPLGIAVPWEEKYGSAVKKSRH